MKKYKIRLSDNSWVENFQACAVIITDNENRAGYYSKSIAVKRLADRFISDYTLIQNNNMKIQIKSILEAHRTRTGERVSLNQIAREMTSEGLFCSFASARGMIYYNTSGKAKSLDIEMIEFLKRRFNLTTCEVIED